MKPSEDTYHIATYISETACSIHLLWIIRIPMNVRLNQVIYLSTALVLKSCEQLAKHFMSQTSQTSLSSETEKYTGVEQKQSSILLQE